MQFQQPNFYNYNQRMSNGIIWVQGIEGAKAYQLMPNSNVILMDSETDNRFYIKTSDSVGMCNLRIFEYNEVTGNTSSIDTAQFVTKEELKAVIKELRNEHTIQPVKSEQLLGDNKPSETVEQSSAIADYFS